jgi:hypothetical protein
MWSVVTHQRRDTYSSISEWALLLTSHFRVGPTLKTSHFRVGPTLNVACPSGSFPSGPNLVKVSFTTLNVAFPRKRRIFVWGPLLTSHVRVGPTLK